MLINIKIGRDGTVHTYGITRARELLLTCYTQLEKGTRTAEHSGELAITVGHSAQPRDWTTQRPPNCPVPLLTRTRSRESILFNII